MSTLLAINNYFYERGGAEAVFFSHNRMMTALGWNVVPFAMKHEKNVPSAWADYFVDEIEMGRDYSLAQNLVRASKVVYSFEARHRLDELLDRVRPDVAHAHNIYHHISPSILGLLRKRHIPTVLTLHDLKVACPAYTMLAPDGICERCRGGRIHNVLRHRCIHGSLSLSFIVMLEAATHLLLGSYRRHVDRFIVPSRFYLEKLCEWGLPRASLRHVPNFVDASRYEPDFRPGRHYVYFGRVAAPKGLATLIQAVAASGSSLTVAGTGPELPALRALAERLGARVEFAGHLAGDTLHAAVRSARAVVLPSEWYENAPISILEAYALGKPVIGARIGGIPELIREHQTGRTFDSGSVASLSAALDELSGLPDSRVEQMGQAGRDWVDRDFTLAGYRERILATYRDIGVNVPSLGLWPLQAPS